MSAARLFAQGVASSAIGALALSVVLAGAGIASAPWLTSAVGAIMGSVLGWVLVQNRLRSQ